MLIAASLLNRSNDVINTRATLGLAVLWCSTLLIFLRGVSVNKIPLCGIRVIPNPALCDVCILNPWCSVKLGEHE